MNNQPSLNLSSKKEIILKLWQERVLKEVSSAGTADTLALRNSLPTYLEHLSDALATNRRMDVRSVLAHDNESVRIGRLHGEDRAGTASYVLTEVIFEYHILREVIFDVLEEKEQLSKDHRDIIFSSIEQAVNDAAVKFSEVHADIQQKFVSTLTHDLKTPLTSAKLAAQLILKRSDKPDDCIRSASRIIGNLNRLSSMIHDLLDVSLLRAGQPLSLQFVNCDLIATVRDAVDDFTDMHDGRVVLDAKGSLEGNFGCDGFRRAVENLVGNAIKYGDKETPIKISVSHDQNSISVSVHNQGTPIPSDEMPLLFEQYRRAKTAHESNQTGWGLGLTLVKGVVDAHEGEIHVESVQGKGTTFTIQIPFKAATN